jgi:hypothetical protein
MQAWEPRRYIILLVVLAMHAALFAGLFMISIVRAPSMSTPLPVELLFLPPAQAPKIRLQNFHPRLSTETVVSLAPTLSDAVSDSPRASRANGANSTVDWEAERRRALQAYEIRSGRLADGNSHPSVSADAKWWPQAPHHAGERYKTESGDWIVWINANCYQIAAASTPVYGVGGAYLQTICPQKDTKTGGEPAKETP